MLWFRAACETVIVTVKTARNDAVRPEANDSETFRVKLKTVAAKKDGKAGDPIELRMSAALLRSPDRPHLYELQVELVNDAKSIVVPHGGRKTCNPSDIKKLLTILDQ